MTTRFLTWLPVRIGSIPKPHLFLLLAFLVLPNAMHATDCLVSPVLPCTFTLTEPFDGSNWSVQPIRCLQSAMFDGDAVAHRNVAGTT
jgi:hypothetical protein